MDQIMRRFCRRLCDKALESSPCSSHQTRYEQSLWIEDFASLPFFLRLLKYNLPVECQLPVILNPAKPIILILSSIGCQPPLHFLILFKTQHAVLPEAFFLAPRTGNCDCIRSAEHKGPRFRLRQQCHQRPFSNNRNSVRSLYSSSAQLLT